MRKLGIALMTLALGCAFFMIKGGAMWTTQQTAFTIILAECLPLGSIYLAMSFSRVEAPDAKG